MLYNKKMTSLKDKIEMGSKEVEPKKAKVEKLIKKTKKSKKK